jgi:hypothetical protein
MSSGHYLSLLWRDAYPKPQIPVEVARRVPDPDGAADDPLKIEV